MNPTKRIISGLMVCAMTMLLTGCDLFFDLIDNPINTTISMRTAELKLQIGQQETRTATSLSPATITYASADPAVATVTQQGTVTALKEGTTRITASVDAVDYWTAASVSYLVTVVSGKKPVTSVTINKPSTSIVVGQTETLQVATITPDDATDKTIVWSSGDKTIATVDPATGLVTGVAAGTVSITATATQGTADTSDDVSAACEVTILSPVSYVRYDVSGTTATAVNTSTTEPYTELSNTSTDVTWTSGTYVVLSDVTISANVSLPDGADVKLIICDGKELKVNSIEGKNSTLTVYGQSASTGKLTADYTNTSTEKDAIWVRYLHVHGGVITAKSNNNSALSIGVANVSPFKYGYLNLYHGQVSAIGGTNASDNGLSGMIISGDLTVYSGNINAQGGAGTDPGEGGLFFYTQNGKQPQFNNYGGTIIAKGGDATDSQAFPGIQAFQKLSIYNDGTIQVTGGKSLNDYGGYGLELDRGGSLSGSGTMEITGGDGNSSGYGLRTEYGCTFEYQSGKLTVLGGLKNNSTNRQEAIDGDLTNKSGASVTFQYTTDGTNWADAAPTANNANFANSSSYKGVRVGY